VFRIPGVDYITNCPICRHIKLRDDLIIEQNSRFIIFACERPYNNGHIIIALREHKSIYDVNSKTFSTMLEIAKKCLTVLSKAYTPHGFNLDIVHEPHLAIQIVPRWNGDASFVSVFHGTRVIAEPPHMTVRYIRSICQELGVRLLE